VCCRAFVEAQIAGLQTIDDNDDRWLGLFSSTLVESSTEHESDFNF
jgi:hypothetical protein